MEDTSSVAGWRRSSRCATGSCIEANLSQASIVLVRDSKLDDGPVLTFSVAAWRSFTAEIKSGSLLRS